MNHSASYEIAADRFGRKITARLNAGQAELPYVVTERLRAGREQALSVRKRPALSVSRAQQEAYAQSIHINSDGSATLSSGPQGGWMPHWLRNALTVVPIAAMVAGIAFVGVQQDNTATAEVAELDTALLTDTLPPDAYTDPGFIQFLQGDGTPPAH